MKINNSTIKFNMGAYTAHKYTSIEDVPYWSLYSLPNDCIEKETGRQWRSDRAITLDELKEYLQRYDGKRKLMAYPRKSANRRNSYKIKVKANVATIADKWSNKVAARFTFVQDINKWFNTYIDNKHNMSYYKKLLRYM